MTQEKWNFSLVLMETIVDTLLKVTNAKLKILQLRKFIHWKNTKYDSRLIQWVKRKETLAKLAKLYLYFYKKTVMKRLSKWSETTVLMKIKSAFDADLEEIKGKYKTKLMMMNTGKDNTVSVN